MVEIEHEVEQPIGGVALGPQLVDIVVVVRCREALLQIDDPPPEERQDVFHDLRARLGGCQCVGVDLKDGSQLRTTIVQPLDLGL